MALGPMEPGRAIEELRRMATAVEPADVVLAIRSLFGHGSRLYAIDHEFGHLHELLDDGDIVLTGALREALVQGNPHVVDDKVFVPVCERDEPVFVVSMPSTSVPDGIEATASIVGLVTVTLRRRFEELERRRRRREMSLAADFQWDLLPLRADHGRTTSVAAVLEPAYDVAGDTFDYAFSDERTWVYSLDGMGHGVGATLMSTLAMAAIRNRRRVGGDLAAQFHAANETIIEAWGDGRFVTGVGICVGVGGEVEAVNAGHEPVRIVRDGTLAQLDLYADLPLGIETGHQYRLQRLPHLAEGDGVILLSDGPAAIRDEHGALLGDERVDEILSGAWSGRPLHDAHGAMSSFLDAAGDRDVDDDLTLVVLAQAPHRRAG